MKGFSLRTLLLAITGFGIICGLFVARSVNADVAHLLLVLAFAVPGGSYGYDRGRTSRSAAVGTCVAAVAGTVAISALIIVLDYWQL